MGRKRADNSKLDLLDKVKSRKMKGLCGVAPPPAALIPERYFAGGFHQGAPVYFAAPSLTGAPFACPAMMPPFFPARCVPPLLALTSQPPGVPLVDPSGAGWPAPPGETIERVANRASLWRDVCYNLFGHDRDSDLLVSSGAE